MSRRARIVLALLLALSGADRAGADETIERRLAALRRLADPGASAAPAPVARSADPCAWLSRGESGSAHLRERTDRAVRHAALRYGLDPSLLRAVIRHESAGNPRAVSSRGAQGLMQLMPATARELGVVCPFDPRQNVLGGARYLRGLHLRFGNWPLALAAYHAGPSRIEARRIPGETRRYVRRVVASWRPTLLAWIDLD